jgi:hypothetical protein
MAAAMGELNMAEQRDVVAEKQASTANGALETSTFTVAARVRPLSDRERQMAGPRTSCVVVCGTRPGGSERQLTHSINSKLNPADP